MRTVLSAVSNGKLTSLALAVIVMGLLVAGCSGPSEQAELIGEYEAKFDYGIETLALMAEGKYDQHLAVSATGETVSHSGRWTFDQRTDTVILNDPLLFDDNFGKLNPEFRAPVSGGRHLDVRVRPGSLALVWNDDQGVEFRRTRR